MKKSFTLGASTIPGEFIIPGLLSAIMKDLPGIELKVDIEDSMKIFEKVKSGALEIGIVGTKYQSPDAEFSAIVRDDRLVLIAPNGHPLSTKESITLNDLKGQSFVTREPGSGTRAAYEKALEDAGIRMADLNVIAEIGDTEGIIQAVEGGAGVSVVSELAAKEAIELGKVRVLDVPMLKMIRDFYIVTRTGVKLSPEATDVLSVIKKVMK